MKIRCYLPPGLWDRSIAQLTGRQAHHLVSVLRVTSGTPVTCFDGLGHEAEALVERVTRKQVSLRLKERRSILPSPWQITLAVAVPRGGGLDRIVDQATQLGVSSIVPLVTARSVVRIPANRAEKRISRLTQVAIEAGKQSGSSRLPTIHPVTSWDPFLSSLKRYDWIFIATVQGPHERLSELLTKGSAREILLLIGPEGDFTAQEIEQALEKGAHRISLGPTVLRVETAAVAALSVIFFLLRDLSA